MNNVGVFGDSFTDPSAVMYQTWSNRHTSYGKNGSDIYFSYMRFLQNHEKHDRIIFAVSSPWRHSRQMMDNEWIHFADYNTLEKQVEQAGTSRDAEIYGAQLNWHKSVFTPNRSRERNISEALINQIQVIRPDTLFIRLFGESPGPVDFYLHNVCVIEQGNIVVGDWRDPSYDGIVDLRMQHLTRESHDVIHSEIEKAFENGDQWLNIDYDIFRNIKFDKNEYFVSWNDERNTRKKQRDKWKSHYKK